MKTKPKLDNRSPKARIRQIESDLDEAELAEDARFLLQVYREMVVEEDRARKRAEVLTRAISDATVRLGELEGRLTDREKFLGNVKARAAKYDKWIKDAEKRKFLAREVKFLEARAKELRPIAARVLQMQHRAKDFQAQENNAKNHLAKIEGAKATHFFPWDSIYQIASKKHQKLAEHVEEVMADVLAKTGRKPNVILMHADTYKGLTKQEWDGGAIRIGGVRVEQSKFVMPGKVILRF